MKCIRCQNEIPSTKNSTKYCSNRCSKLYLKAQYKKRNKEKLNQYNREYRMGVRRGVLKGRNVRKFEREGTVKKIHNENGCYFCGDENNLEWHHVSYEAPIVVMRFCRGCHRKLHRILKFEEKRKKYINP